MRLIATSPIQRSIEAKDHTTHAASSNFLAQVVASFQPRPRGSLDRRGIPRNRRLNRRVVHWVARLWPIENRKFFGGVVGSHTPCQGTCKPLIGGSRARRVEIHDRLPHANREELVHHELAQGRGARTTLQREETAMRTGPPAARVADQLPVIVSSEIQPSAKWPVRTIELLGRAPHRRRRRVHGAVSTVRPTGARTGRSADGAIAHGSRRLR